MTTNDWETKTRSTKITYHPSLEHSFESWASVVHCDTQSLRHLTEEAIVNRHSDAC